MPSTYTQNLGIELPATGEQANVWGVTVNRNMNTLDLAMNGNVQLPLSTSPFLLLTDNGADFPIGANRLIIWTGAQTSQGTVRIDWQTTRKHIYFMSNQTSGGFGIAFTQGSGGQFVLQAGRDAILYSDGGGATASVGSALANPQFTSMLATGNVSVGGNLQVTGTTTLTGAATLSGNGTVTGSLTVGAGLSVTGNAQVGSLNGILTTDAQGNVHLTGGLGITNPAAIPDPLTVTGIGSGGQLRLAYGPYGVIFRNDGATFYLGITNTNDAYGAWKAPFPLTIDLATCHVGVGGGPNYPLTVFGDVNVVSGTYRINGAALTFNTPPGGANQQIQFNNNGAFGGSANLLWDGSRLHVGSGSIYTAANNSTVITSPALVELPVNTTTAHPASTSGVAFGWNMTGGKGEVDVWNAFEAGPGSNEGGFQFLQLFNGSPRLVFQVGTGSIQFPLLASGTVMSTQGFLYVSSDSRLKNVLGQFTGGLQAVLQLSPVRFRWRPESGLPSDSDHVGFVAQDVQQAIPEAVDADRGGMLSLSDRPLIAALVNAVKELEARLSALESAWSDGC